VTSAAPPPFRILYVCVANICRSVLAERLTRLEMAGQPVEWARHFQVSSAGTRGRDGQRMHPHIGSLLSTWGADPTGFAARRVTPALVQETDLVLTATTQERDEVIGMLPTTLRRTFTINEFARLATWLGEPDDHEDRPAPAARRLVIRALAARGLVRPDAPLPDGTVLPDDIVDPTGGTAAFQKCGGNVRQAVRAVVGTLRGSMAATSVHR